MAILRSLKSSLVTNISMCLCNFWIKSQEKKVEEWSHPAQDMRKMSCERQNACMDETPARNLGMMEVARQSQARHQRREGFPY